MENLITSSTPLPLVLDAVTAAVATGGAEGALASIPPQLVRFEIFFLFFLVFCPLFQFY